MHGVVVVVDLGACTTIIVSKNTSQLILQKITTYPNLFKFVTSRSDWRCSSL